MSNQVSKDIEFQILYDHYKDSCINVREDIKARSRVFLFIVVLLMLQFLQITDPSETSKAMVGLFKNKVGLDVSVNQHAIGIIIWFALLSLVVRYYQINVYINRQYKYLHKLESRFKEISGKEMISREGGHYLLDYPAFSNGIHVLYTWVFPFLILLTGALKIYNEFPGNWQFFYFFNSIFFLAIVVFTFLYLRFIHKK